MPPFPEDIPEAHVRFVTSVQSVVEGYPTKNVVCVTHGPAIDALVVRYAGDSKLAVVDLCGFLHLTNESGSWVIKGTQGVQIIDG